MFVAIGFGITNTDVVINQNGDDAVELYFNNNIIESLGEADIDGTGQDWEYTGSWAYKNNTSWIFGELDCSSGNTTFELSLIHI